MLCDSPAAQIIAALGLEPLPREGGFYRQTWRNPTGSAILFLLTPADFSAIHRLTQDELWHFYAGDAVTHAQFNAADGAVRVRRMGPDVLAGEAPQVHVPAGVWQGAKLAGAAGEISAKEPGTHGPHGYALLGCTLSPPWDERGFTLGCYADLIAAFPGHDRLIEALTR